MWADSAPPPRSQATSRSPALLGLKETKILKKCIEIGKERLFNNYLYSWTLNICYVYEGLLNFCDIKM